MNTISACLFTNSQVQDSALLRGSFGTALNNEIDTLVLCPISQNWL